MKKFLLVIFTMLLLPCILFGQNRKRLPKPQPLPLTKADGILAEKHNKCFNSHKYKANERRSFFPFGNASTIKLISSEAYNIPEAVIYVEGKDINADTAENNRMRLLTPVTKGRYYLNLKKVKEIKVLTVAGIDSLTDILYNVGYTPIKKTVPDLIIEASCYEPRNAVLFLDAKGNIMQYLEICFECRHHYWSSSKVGYIEYCDDKYELLRRYFLAQGVKYGAEPKTINNE